MSTDVAGIDTVDRTAVLQRRVRWLVGAVIAYNVLEAVTAITAGALASSTALVGFGLDSIVEVTSALAITWQYAHHTPSDRAERALRIVAYSFFALAVYVGVDAALSLTGSRQAAHSPLGIGLAALSMIVMPIASVVERRTGQELGSASVVADSKQLLLCSYLSAVLLAGLVINSTLGWSWADPVAGLLITGLALREGRNALSGDVCCAPPAALLSEPAEGDASEVVGEGMRARLAGPASLTGRIPTGDGCDTQYLQPRSPFQHCERLVDGVDVVVDVAEPDSSNAPPGLIARPTTRSRWTTSSSSTGG